ncbi:phytoene/squalene synthase family protein [Corynebacterium auriscanis]|uniref:phytoene/squalene synthase family protein n=1 Tax=Corynebacterium auriscanis TaxID=99807 RepID=UPI003CF36AE7
MRAFPAAFMQYSRVAETIAADVISSYSSSFSLASRLLDEPVRTHIRNIYGMVRVADEIVDGAASGAGLSAERVLDVLDEYERSTLTALQDGFSPDLILQAFTNTARWAEINTQHIRDFFHSMRLDAHSAASCGPTSYTSREAAEYIHGSAGVIGWMCNAVFLKTSEANGRVLTDAEKQTTERAAYALGSAFQKVNFLRDYRHDSAALARFYLPQLVDGGLTEQAKTAIVQEIRSELRTAQGGIHLLPEQAFSGVVLAHDLFAELTEKLDRTPAHVIARERVRIPNRHKLRIVARAQLRVTGRRFRPSTSPMESSSRLGHPSR